MTCGSTDVLLCGFAFVTKGINKFMEEVMNIDKQDLISKMEGFAIQGIKGLLSILNIILLLLALYPGAATNHKACVSGVQSAIREIINKKLHKFTYCF